VQMCSTRIRREVGVSDKGALRKRSPPRSAQTTFTESPSNWPPTWAI